MTSVHLTGHAGVEGNEVADGVAKEAAGLSQDRVPINLGAAKARLKLHLGREWVESNRHLRDSNHFDIVGPGRIHLADKLGLTRAEGVALARLRTEESTLTRAYLHKIGREEDPTCTRCDDGVPEDVEHMLTDCPASARLRRTIFGRDDPSLREVFSDAARAVSFLRRLGRL